MEICTVETGLLRKTPCGQTSVTKCANCERPLCGKHAVAQLSATGHKTGAFMCAECEKAQRAHEKNIAAAPRPAAVRPAPKPPAGAAASPARPAAPAPAPAKPAAVAPAKPAENSDGSIDFTPSKK